jgi:uncharacterized protein YgbK (DUF1537 family)
VNEDAQVDVVLRSDSTLRGHFPLEARLVEEVFGPSSAWILSPAFFEGGRITVDDVPYVREGNELIPAGQTPFAMDKAFGYRSSNLRDWVSEKFEATDVPKCQSISITELRERGSTNNIASRLKELAVHRNTSPDVMILNVFSPADMETFVAARALVPEVNLVYRTGASFVFAYLHIAPIAPLSPKSLFPGARTGSTGVGGLIIIGSYVPKTTTQRTYLLDRCKDHVSLLELDVNHLLSSTDQNRKLITQCAQSIEEVISAGKDAVLSTSRTLITSVQQQKSLEMGRIVSGVLIQITTEVSVKPKYIIAKVCPFGALLKCLTPDTHFRNKLGRNHKQRHSDSGIRYETRTCSRTSCHGSTAVGERPLRYYKMGRCPVHYLSWECRRHGNAWRSISFISKLK